ncbi:hypothetical protein Ancab_002635 [Ancistrocladus abbreviatus]
MKSFTALVLLMLLCMNTLLRVSGDIGTATSYNPPYLPTRCGGYSQQQFPESGFFAAVSDGLWDNGAACGRRYRVRCISGPRGSCKNGEITVTVVDFCKNTPCHAMMLLSKAAFSAISSIPNANINVEYTEI